jgi:hypothetical protein
MIENNVHPAVAIRRQFRGSTTDSRRTEVLNPLDNFFGKELEATLDKDLFSERVPNLHCGTLGGATLIEGLAGKDRCPTDSISPGPGPKEHNLVSRTARAGEMEIFVAEDSKR